MTEAELKQLQEALVDAKSRADKAEAALAEAIKQTQAAQGRVDSLESEAVVLREARKDAAVVEKLQAQVTALSTQIDSERKLRKDAEDPKRFQTAVMERARIESAARAILGDKFRADSDNRTLQLAVLEKVQGPVDKNKAEQDAYVAARFDAAVDAWTAGERALRNIAEEKIVREETRADSRSARDQMIADRRKLVPLSDLSK